MKNYIAENIIYLRNKIGDTQAEFGNRFNISRDRIASYERGVEPRLELVLRFVKYFNITTEDFVYSDLSTKSPRIIPSNKIEDKTKSIQNVTCRNLEQKTKSTQNVTLLKGDKKGDILDKNEKYTKSHPLESESVKEYALKTDTRSEEQIIPLYNIEATAGLVPLFTNQEHILTEGYISIPNMPRCDGAIRVTGDSMYPLLKSGDIVLYKQVNDIANNIFWGEMYLISIDNEGEEYVTVKYIQRSDQEAYIRLVSHNQHHSDKEVHLSKVMALAFIKASVRINSMK